MFKKSIEQGYEELSEIEKDLIEMDFSTGEGVERMRERFRANLEKCEEEKKIHAYRRFKKPAVAIASLFIVGILALQTTSAQNLVQSFVQRISLGNIGAEYLDLRTGEPVPAEYKGKLFDSNGNLIEIMPKTIGELYTAEGEQVIAFVSEDVAKDGILTASREKKWAEANSIIVAEDEEESFKITDTSILSQYTCFEVKMPNYLPEGYVFDYAELHPEKEGERLEDIKNRKIISLYFTKKGEEGYIYMSQRFNCEETAGEAGAGEKPIKIDINGNPGIMYDNAVVWTTEKVNYMLIDCADIGREECQKIARSIQ
ncbi:DUF4367 domain-containing protein [Alkaliphilus peptidifermentans]|uniref:DUF4367 domain-containing protein n=1 Tax=Alkaliphilus peptidifermentans DSM 18978 TaxID=1120976 RepID=A0A1G5H8A7_9FIRM|nr:DUF4367 domain-containing protein [Alkaliphilus peptidifermentans]SCY60125.1 protein of unknown function [Alkaliphilus peptidifermentans DSM 18978]